jgi:uncharacterized protein (DUF58 family)
MNEIPLLLLLLLGVAILLRLDFVFYLVYVLVGIFSLARWWTVRSLPRLRVQRHFTDRAFLGETVAVDIEVENMSWWPVPWLRLDEMSPEMLLVDKPVRQVVALRPREHTHLRYELMGRHRGYYEIGPAMLSAGDLFGFSEVHGQTERQDHLVVYPRVIPLTRVELTSRSPLGTIKSRQHIFADPARVVGVRDYQPGDPLRSIDWKSSARAGTLQVKKLEPAVSLATVIFLDLNAAAYGKQTRYQYSEWGIVLAASLANYLISQRQAVGLACNGVDMLTKAQQWSIPPRPGRTHLMKLLEWLARVQVEETMSLAEWLPTAALDLAWGTVVIAVTPTGDEAICGALHRLLRAGLNPVLVVTEPHGQFGQVRERARRLGLAAHLVAGDRDLAQWRAPYQRVSAA